MDKDKNLEKYGEMVCTSFHWLPIDEQKKKAKKLKTLTSISKKEEEQLSDQNLLT